MNKLLTQIIDGLLAVVPLEAIINKHRRKLDK